MAMGHHLTPVKNKPENPWTKTLLYMNIFMWTYPHIDIFPSYLFILRTSYLALCIYIYYNIYIIHTIFSPPKKWRSVSQFACTLCPLLKGALFLSPARRRHKCQCLDLWVDLRLRHTGPKRPKRRVEAHFFPQIIPWLVHRNLQNPDFMGQKKQISI